MRTIALDADMVLLAVLDRNGEFRLRRARAGEDRIAAFLQQQREDALGRLARLQLPSSLAPVSFTRIVEHGFWPTVVQYVERRVGADLLVLPNDAAPRLRRWFFRSLAGEAMARSDCDVLLIPHGAA
ncbi:universal stress protein [Massilia consociata]|uniref:Universal stress protein n=1 Tax=Massilia consociata TaxID=760117 RepID=A0ABV6FAB8_9BURK